MKKDWDGKQSLCVYTVGIASVGHLALTQDKIKQFIILKYKSIL